MSKIALLIGVTDYPPGLSSLPSAERDIQELHRVLQAPEIGGFDQVKPLLNPNPQEMQEEIETLFRDRERDDLVFLFFSGHGIKDDSGKLYFATSLTHKTQRGELVKSTAVPANFVHEIMSNSRSRRQVVMLDCCFSGAFAEGMKAKDDGRVDVQKQLGGEGRAVLTSSTSTQYSFEQQGTELSIYTHYIIEGIETGSADQDNDGAIAVDELHQYAKQRVQEAAPAMKPEIFTSKEGFHIKLAQALIGDPKLRYRREVSRFAERGEISDIGRLALDARRQALGLTREDVSAIETDVLTPSRTYRSNLRQYEQKLLEATLREYPMSAATRSDLDYLQQALGLRDEDVEPIELHISTRHREFGMAVPQSDGVPPDEMGLLQSGQVQLPTSPSTTQKRQPHSSQLIPASLLRRHYRWVPRLLAASITLVIGSAGFYGYQQWQWSQQGQTELQEAITLANQEQWKDAIAKLQQISVTSAVTGQAQQYLDDWSNQLLKHAEERYQSGSLEEALGYAQTIPQSSSVYNDAQKVIVEWQTSWNRDHQLLTEIDQVLTVWDIDTAGFLLNQIQNPGLRAQAETHIAEISQQSVDVEQKKRQQAELAKQQEARARQMAEAVAAVRLNQIHQQQQNQLSSPNLSLPDRQPTDEKTGMVFAGDGYANLRSFASAENPSNIISRVPNGSSVIILEELINESNQVWCRVQVGGQTGWMLKDLIRAN